MQTNRWLWRVFPILLALVGAWLIWQSPSLADSSMLAELNQRGGGMDTNAFNAMLQAYAASYRLLGAVILGVSLFRALQDIS